MITANMLNHPSTAPNVERLAFFSHLHMQFVLRRQPLTDPSPFVKDDTYVGVTIQHPNDPTLDFVIDMPPTAEVIFQ